MSKGNQQVSLRIDPKGLCAIANDMLSRMESTDRRVVNISEWIKEAIQEKLDHLERGRVMKGKPLRVTTIDGANTVFMTCTKITRGG